MISKSYRRKPHDIQMQKQNYQRHLSRLEEIQSHNSHSLAKKASQLRKVSKIIQMVHDRHQRSRKHDQNERSQLLEVTNKLNSNRIKSVVRNDFVRDPFIMPARHKKNDQELLNQNQKIYEKILNIKPYIVFDQLSSQRISHLPLISDSNSNDFLHLLKHSKLNKLKKKTIPIKLGKKKGNTKIFVECDKKNLLAALKEKSQLYRIQIKCGNLKAKTEQMILEELLDHSLTIQIRKKDLIENNITLTYYRILPEKELYKGEIVIISADMGQQKELTKKQFTYQRSKKLYEIDVTMKVKNKLKKNHSLNISD